MGSPMDEHRKMLKTAEDSFERYSRMAEEAKAENEALVKSHLAGNGPGPTMSQLRNEEDLVALANRLRNTVAHLRRVQGDEPDTPITPSSPP
ncbi:methylase of polypeptide subunit release factors [Roseateles terrae]|uniref:Methylase of polypeptide subunit release factors n=1 Tax=Roseateles terrae TaxID=431060 RepID=A0ABR6GS53_9BURK|nr:methylase of polypeptide subunit release factors [Roseateles terrae]